MSDDAKLREMAKKMIEMDPHRGHFCEGEFNWRNEKRLDDGNGNWLLEWRHDELSIWPEVREAIAFYLSYGADISGAFLLKSRQLEAAMKALEFYSEKENWESFVGGVPFTMQDSGKAARKVLTSIATMESDK